MLCIKHFAFVLSTTAGFLLSCSTAAAGFIVDPSGDTFGFGPVQLDIMGYGVDANTPGKLHFHVDFYGAIAPGSAFAPNSVIGFIDLDTDADATTGATPWINQFSPGPPVNLRDEFYVDIGSEQNHPGLVDVVNANTNIPTGQASITFGGSFFDVFVELSLVPGGNTINSAIIVGTFDESTDRAPNDSTPDSVTLGTTATPEPASLMLACFGTLGLGGYAWRRRKAG